MRVNRLVRVGLAILAVGLLLWVVSKLFGRRDTTTATAPPPSSDGVTPVSDNSHGRTVLAASQEIPDHSILTREMLKEVPFDGASSGGSDFVTTGADATVGFITGVWLHAGAKIKPGDLLGHITQVGIAGALRANMRAIVVPIAKPTLHDLVKIGDYVDIVATSQGEEARTIVPRVRVLAVDVFGKDYPPVKVAMRGDYKASASGVSAANPPTARAAVPPPAAPANPGEGPAVPTPTPTNAPPAPAPAPALTLEVTPDQATRLSLAIASSAVLDFLLVSPYESTVVASAPTTGGTPVAPPVVSMTKNRLFPYASRKSGGAPAAAGTATRTVSLPAAPRRSRPPKSSPPDWGPRGPGEGGPIPPLNNLPSATYQIPIYADGKLVRVDTVRRPTD